MRDRDLTRSRKDRLRAVFLCVSALYAYLLLAGCSSSNPAVATLTAFLPGRADVSERAGELSYASIDFAAAGRGGLLVLAESSQELTFWQSSRRETVVLRGGYLESTSGLTPELQLTEISTDTDEGAMPWRLALDEPAHYTLTRTWTRADGSVDTGRADATLSCATGAVEKKLPLTTLELERCVEKLVWERGATTTSVFWRDRGNHRIWAAAVVAWPGSPLYEWRVARPWW